jgi:hypothetical protein
MSDPQRCAMAATLKGCRGSMLVIVRGSQADALDMVVAKIAKTPSPTRHSLLTLSFRASKTRRRAVEAESSQDD